jgi:mono/diheme cytochrome c family protein
MRARVAWITPAAVAFLVPTLLIWYGGAAGAVDPSPSPSPSAPSALGAAGLPGDPVAGDRVYHGAGGCTTCHGANLEGGVGARLHPIDGGAPNLKPEYLIDVITNGKTGSLGKMPARGGQSPDKVTDKDVRDLAAFIIVQNKSGKVTLSPRELAISNVEIVALGIIVMVAVTYLLARYNMRWVARRAARR